MTGQGPGDFQVGDSPPCPVLQHEGKHPAEGRREGDVCPIP